MNRMVIIGSNLLKTVFVLCIGTIVLTGCGSPGASKSSEAEITELTLTIGGKEYKADFAEDNAATIVLPSSVPSVTVDSVTLSAGASGVAKGEELQVRNDKISITVTAEDGTTTATYIINMEYKFFVSRLDRSDDTQGSSKYRPDDYWSNIIPFKIKTGKEEFNGEYRMAVRNAADAKPTADELRSTTAAISRNLSTSSINVLLGFHMDTAFFDADTVWADNIDFDLANGAMLQPETSYKLYGVSTSGDESVYTLLEFTTDAAPDAALRDTLSQDKGAGMYYYNASQDTNYIFRQNEPILIPVGILASETSVTLRIEGSILTNADNRQWDTLPTKSLSLDMYFTGTVIESAKDMLFVIADKDFLHTETITSGETKTWSMQWNAVYQMNFMSTTFE